MNALLPLTLAIPAGGAVASALLGPTRGPAVRTVALGTSLVTLALVLVATLQFVALPPVDDGVKTFQPRLTTVIDLIPLQSGERSTAIQFFIGLDGLNVWLIVLTAVLMVPAVLVSWTAIEERVNEFYAWLLVLQVGMLGVFLAFDILLFYVFFELTLVPLFFLIGIWGGSQRQLAARKFFLFTLAGSVVTLLGVLGISLICYYESPERELSFSIPRLVTLVQDRLTTGSIGELAYWRTVQIYVFLALMAGFAIKVPLVPVHTWLPLAHVEAPTAGSVLLAGVLLKIGTYGFLRLCLPLAPDAALSLGAPLIGWLAVIGVIYGACCAYAQGDIKKLVAYSSVSHLGICMLGLFALNETGIAGSLIQMVNHGLSTGGLFLLVGMLYERYHTRQMADYGGMASKTKLLAVAMVFMCLSSAGLPGLNGFWGEALSLMGIATTQAPGVQGWLLAALGGSGVVLGAWYLMTMLRKVFFGPLKEPHADADAGHHPRGDLNGRELTALAPIVALCLLLGLFPSAFFRVAERDVKLVASLMDSARERARVAEQAAQASIAPAQGLQAAVEEDR